MIDADAKAIIRTARDALLEARSYVLARHDAQTSLLLGREADVSRELLERVDGAIAEADEVLT